ncbi:hypothetical protein QCA50_010395 [Cerrena zonata]|uniref:P-loop containing nucleoside triphosphate hydrolase protein n=1 Tax=Cerrena zonata TaxID=2478898 RepID=A0AAW0FYA9_9APHY
MDPTEIIQKAVTLLATLSQDGNLNMTTATNSTTSADAPATTINAAATGISSLLTMLLSFSALRDWLKLFVIGGLIETCRRLLFSAWAVVVESFWITATFDYDDDSYNWIMYWLSKHPKWGRARTVEVSTRSFGLNSPAVTVEGDEASDANRRLAYLPSFSETYSLWYKRRYMCVTRTKVQESYYRTSETLQIKILARDHNALTQLLLDAKKSYQAAQEHLITVYASDTCNNWRQVATRPKRPMKSIVLDPGIKDLILDDARDFLESKTWYQERGIPFRRGYLLYGAPGSGKTSIIQSLAGELGLDVYVISLSRMGLDDSSLSELISELPEKCIALMEDIDAAFHRGLNRNMDDDVEKQNLPPDEKDREPKEDEKPSRITLSGLLNALDGVGAQEGRILFATTNRYGALDPALCRPGRMDMHIEFKLASKFQATELYQCFYLPTESKVTEKSDKVSEKQSEKDDDDSAYASGSSSATSSEPGDLIDLSDTPPPTPSPVSLLASQSHRLRAPKLSAKQVAVLAARFAESIPEREVSMASLQGYLMTYKTRPVEAANEASAWAEKQRAEKEKRKKSLTTTRAPSAPAPAPVPTTVDASTSTSPTES